MAAFDRLRTVIAQIKNVPEAEVLDAKVLKVAEGLFSESPEAFAALGNQNDQARAGLRKLREHINREVHGYKRELARRSAEAQPSEDEV